MEPTLRPTSLVAQQSSQSVSGAYEEHGNVLASYQTLEIQTGSTMLSQHHPQYLGFANPFTLPVAVGGYDMSGKKRWRRPINSVLEEERDATNTSRQPLHLETSLFRSQLQVEPAKVKLYDVTRGMPRRIEGQYRRHWAFVPTLWNLYFREQVNLGVGLSAGTKMLASAPQEDIEQDAAMAAAELYKHLQSGHYRTQNGKRMKIDGDMTKLRFAEGISAKQKQLLAE